MEPDYKKLIGLLPPKKPHSELIDTILLRIDQKEKWLLKKRLILTAFLSSASFIGLVPTLTYLLSSFSQSGFYQYLSLLISDQTIIRNYWQEFLLSLVESLPLLGLTIFMTILLLFLVTLSKTIKQVSSLIVAA